MAKGKHAAALFEVIHSGKPMKMPAPPRPRRDSWLGSVLKNTGSSVAAAGSALRGSATALVVRDRPPAPPKMPKSPVDVSMDSDRQLISLKLTYHSAIVAGFAVLVIVGLAYAVGMKMNHGPTAATASPSSAELRAKGAHPEVLNVNDVARGELITATGGNKTSPPSMSAVEGDTGAGTDPNKAPAQDGETAAPAVERVIGRQYVIVQTFETETTARAAQAFLAKNKIACTIEHGLSGWAPSTKFCVVGTTGFDHLRGNADFDKYEALITKLGDAFADTNKARHFEPRAYRWKGTT